MPINLAVKAVEQQVRRDRQELKWGGDPDTLKILTEGAATRTQANVALIGAEKTRVIKEYARPFRRWFGVELPPDEEPVILMKFVLFIYAASACVALLDAGVSAVIGAATFNLEWGPAAAVGALVALGLTVLFKGLCSQLIGRLGERPRKALAVLDIALVAVAAPWAVSFFGALFIGRFTASASSDLLFNAAITGLAALSPLLSALLLVCAGIRGWDRAPVRLYHRLERIERDLAELQAVCKLPRGEGAAPSRPPSQEGGSARAKAVAVCLIALLLPAAARAQGWGQVWADKSPSPDAAVLAGALASTFVLLPQIAATAGVRQVDVYGFAGDAFDAAPVGQPLRLEPFTPPGCRTRSDRATIFKARDQAQACASKIADARNRHDEATAVEIRRGRDELARHTPLRSARTCLIDLLARLALPGSGGARFAIVITDGVETCEPASKEVLPAPQGTMNVVFVLVPGNASSAVGARRRFQELQRYWEQRAPWLKAVVPSSGLTVDLFRPVAPAPQK